LNAGCWFGQVRTIFVLGFPPNVKERELQNLLRWWPGYEASQMNFKCDQPMGFALFSTSAMAMAARDALQVGKSHIPTRCRFENAMASTCDFDLCVFIAWDLGICVPSMPG